MSPENEARRAAVLAEATAEQGEVIRHQGIQVKFGSGPSAGAEEIGPNGETVQLPEGEVVGARIPTPEELTAAIDSTGELLRSLIEQIKKYHAALPREKFAYHTEPMRSLATAQTELQTGFRWLYHSVSRRPVF